MNWIIAVSAVISAFATLVIAFYAWKSHQLTQAIQKRDEEYKQQTSDLYQAMVISNLLGPQISSNADENAIRIRFLEKKGPIKIFNELYTGQTSIFPEQEN